MKKVRLTPEEAKGLARIAKDRDTTESEILREGLRGLLRIDQRRRNIGQLIQLASMETEPYRKPDLEVKW